MKSGFENIMRIVLFALLICAIGVFVGIGAMLVSVVINPSKPITIFGIRAYNIKEEYSKQIEYNASDFDAIEIDSNRINVVVLANNGTYNTLGYRNSSFGIGKASDNITFTYSIETETVNEVPVRILHFRTNEPAGLLISNTSFFNLGLSTSCNDKDIIFNTTDSDASIQGNNYGLRVKDVTLNSKGGDLSLTKLSKINSLTVKSSSGKITSDTNITSNVNFTSSTGKLEIQNADTVTVNARNAYVSTGNTNAVNITASNGKYTANTITGDVIISGAVKFTASSLSGNLTRTNGGSADLTVSNFKGNANIKATSGNTSLSYSADCASSNTIDFSSKNGSLTVNGFKGAITTNIAKDGTCSMNINFVLINGESKINGMRGAINIAVPDQVVVINAKSSVANNIDCNGVSSCAKETGDLFIKGATSDTINKLTITSKSGKITATQVSSEE